MTGSESLLLGRNVLVAVIFLVTITVGGVVAWQQVVPSSEYPQGEKTASCNAVLNGSDWKATNVVEMNSGRYEYRLGCTRPGRFRTIGFNGTELPGVTR